MSVGDQRGLGDALDAARRTLAARDAELAEADRELADLIAWAREFATDSIASLDAIGAEVEATVGLTRDGATAGAEASRRLVAKTREISALLCDARAAAEAKTVAMKQLIGVYQPAPGD